MVVCCGIDVKKTVIGFRNSAGFYIPAGKSWTLSTIAELNVPAFQQGHYKDVGWN